MNKQPNLRLGAKCDFQEIQKHAFFSSMNWAALERKEIKPPFDPSVVCVIYLNTSKLISILYYSNNYRINLI